MSIWSYPLLGDAFYPFFPQATSLLVRNQSNMSLISVQSHLPNLARQKLHHLFGKVQLHSHALPRFRNAITVVDDFSVVFQARFDRLDSLLLVELKSLRAQMAHVEVGQKNWARFFKWKLIGHRAVCFFERIHKTLIKGDAFVGEQVHLQRDTEVGFSSLITFVHAFKSLS